MRDFRLTTSRPRAKAAVAAVVCGTLLTACGGEGGTAGTGDGSTSEAFTFDGQTVTIFTPWSPGGPTDLTARALASTIGEYLPGKPNVVVKNMDGAGGLVGANFHAENASTDGTEMMVSSGLAHRELLGVEGMQFSLLDLELVSVFSEPLIHYSSARSDVASVDDVLAKGPVTAGGFAGADAHTAIFASINQALGRDVYELTVGYPGSAEVRQAVRQGEVSYWSESLAGWFGAVSQDLGTDFHGIMQTGLAAPEGEEGVVAGFRPDPRIEEYELPLITEVVESEAGPEVWDTPEGQALLLMLGAAEPVRTLTLPEGTDPAAVEAWRTAVEDMLADDAGRAALVEANGYDIVAAVGEDAEATLFGVLRNAKENPEATEALREALLPE